MKELAIKRADEIQDLLFEISNYIFRNPEMGFKEFKAVDYLTGILGDQDFRIARNIASLPTSFHAWKGKGKPRLGLLVEYDAVSPSLGHACGHNMIAASSLGAAIILSEIAAKIGGSIELFGTPAEEEGGGKIYMLEKGVFEGLDAVFYVHPSYNTRIGGRTLATRILDIEVNGKSAHPTRSPHLGHNATSALIHIFQLIDSLKQQFPDGVKTNGVITQGGEYASSINDYAKGSIQVFSEHKEQIIEVTKAIERVVKGIGIATSTKCDVNAGPIYHPRKPNMPLARLMENNMRLLGLEVEDMQAQEQGYTDVGNVSEAVPTVQGYISLNAGKVSNHTPEFADLVGGQNGKEALLQATKIIVMTGIDLLENPDHVKRVHSFFAEGG
jgi:amidohydrolase